MLSDIENHKRMLRFLFEKEPDFSLLTTEEFRDLNYRIEFEKVKSNTMVGKILK